MLDICQWADGLGFDLAYFAEHHSAERHRSPDPDPLFGGTEPKQAWASLRQFETEVLPYIEVAKYETTNFPL